MKILNFIRSSNKLERIFSILEIKLNLLFFAVKPSDALSLHELLLTLEKRSELKELLQDIETENNVEYIRREFSVQFSKPDQRPPFPAFYNADRSFALFVYAIARYICPDSVIETGVGYGITSALILLALRNNGKGILKSIDLHPLSDTQGLFIGFGIPQDLQRGWKLYSGSSRRWLSKILKETGPIGLFVSDSANVFTLQKYEFDCVFPQLTSDGAMIFNNVSLKFKEYVKTKKDIEYYTVWQSEKFTCATIIVFKTAHAS